MYVTDKKWNDIINETRTGIDRWNARATERGLKDTFRVSIATPDKFSVIITEHSSEDFEAHALVRETANGEVHPAKLTIKKDSIVGIKPKPDPKAWKALAEKPARTIIDKAGLLDFFMIIDSRMIQ